MSALPFLIVLCVVVALGLAAFVASIWGAGDFEELDRPLPTRPAAQADPDAEEDGEGHR